MAVPANTIQSQAQVGIREDLSDYIHNVSPAATPFYTQCKKTSVKATNPNWLTDVIRNSADNAHVEGDDTTATAAVARARLQNYTQIFKESATVADTNEGLDLAGRNREMAREIMIKTKALKKDIERALFLNQAAVDDTNGSTARRLAGVPTWLATNTVFESGNSGADPTGNGTDARTDDGTPVAFSQTRMETALEDRFNNSEGAENVTSYLSTFQMGKVLTFTGNNSQRATIDAKTRKVVNNVTMYESRNGMVKFVQSRECRSRDVLILQDNMWEIGVLRGLKNTPLAKTGDSTKRQLVTELTLKSCNEAASAAVYDNTTS